ncbi:MAG: hypothetical protein QOI80_578 [Solirubrobacteraceae bacterium]|jgi:hypothetical protein|nr:hypothetical protein [Solirubrobacteraceae bacterium]
MRARTIGVVAGLALLACAGDAQAAAPIMPLSEVQAGMKCTGFSVFHGQTIETFDVDIVDIVGQAANYNQAPRLLVRVSGDRVKDTGVGPGFSGSPILCPASDGTLENAGAISETVGEYGGFTVLATPIEQILATPVDAPTAPGERRAALRRMSPRDRSILRRARPLSAPISVGGLNPGLMKGLQAAARKKHITLLAAPSVPAHASPVLPFEPGSAFAVGLSSGDLSLAAIGTVAYTDAENVWGFGHSFDGLGARDLILQDAYVAAIINNPVQVEGYSTYKLSGALHDRGTLTDDGFNAVAGRTGALPPLIGVTVTSRDDDRGVAGTLHVNIADETDVGNPAGISPLSWVAPLAISQGPTDILGAAPQQLAGRMCMQITLRGRPKPVRFCNRYISDGVSSGESVGANPVALSAGLDASVALSWFDLYKGTGVHITSADATISETRAQRQAYLRSVKLPKRVRAGALVPATIVVKVVRGERKTFHFLWPVPRKFKPGKHKVRLRGSDPDSGYGFFDDIIIDLSGDDSYFDTEGPRSVKQLIKAFKATHHWDGIRLKSGQRVYRNGKYRIGGRATATVRVLKRR